MDELQTTSPNGDRSQMAPNATDSVALEQVETSTSLIPTQNSKQLVRIERSERKKILRERAKKLGQKREKEDSDSDSMQIIEFRLSHERYGADVNHIREVYPLKDITPIPCTPPFVLGIMNVRGQVVSVLDIRGFFDLPKQPNTELSKVLIVGKDDIECGILTDEIVGEKKIPLGMVHQKGNLMRGDWEECIMGVTADRLILLGIDKLLSNQKIVVQQEVGER